MNATAPVFHCNSVGGTSRRTPLYSLSNIRVNRTILRAAKSIGKFPRKFHPVTQLVFIARVKQIARDEQLGNASTKRGKSIYRTDREERSAMATHTPGGLRRMRISESKISTGYTGGRKTKGKSRNLIRRAVMRQTNERLVLHRNRIFPIAEERKREKVFRVVYAHAARPSIKEARNA